MVAIGTDRICREYSDLGFGGTGLVEDSGMVVNGIRHSSTWQGKEPSKLRAHNESELILCQTILTILKQRQFAEAQALTF
jgi:hypothetical protein